MMYKLLLSCIVMILILAGCSKTTIHPNVEDKLPIALKCVNPDATYTIGNTKLSFSQAAAYTLYIDADKQNALMAMPCEQTYQATFELLNDGETLPENTLLLGYLNSVLANDPSKLDGYQVGFDGSSTLTFMDHPERSNWLLSCEENEPACIAYIQAIRDWSIASLQSALHAEEITPHIFTSRSFDSRNITTLGMGNVNLSQFQKHEQRLILSADVITAIPIEFTSLNDVSMTEELYKAVADAAIWYSCYEDACSQSENPVVTLFRSEWSQFDGMYAVVLEEDFWDAKNELLGDDIALHVNEFQNSFISNARAKYHPDLKVFTNGSESYGGSTPIAILLSYQQTGNIYKMQVIRSWQKDEPTRLLKKDGTWTAGINDSTTVYLWEHQNDFLKWEFTLEDQGNRLMKLIDSNIIP